MLTGRLGPRVQLSGSPSWQIHLNDTETFSGSLEKSSLPAVDFNTWLSPWWGGIAYFWNDQPIFAGPIIGLPSETQNTIQVEARGIRGIFQHRYVVREQPFWTDLPRDSIKYSGLGLGTIAKRVLEWSMTKPSGRLPILYPVPDEPGPIDDVHTRTYDGFNVQNLLTDDVLTKLSGVANGPDIMFKPRMLDSANIVWDFWTGTEGNPRIYQQNYHVWDATALESGVTDLSTTATGAYQTDRVFGIGAGTDQSTAITMVENRDRAKLQFPLLESTVTAGDTTNLSVIAAHAQGTLNQNLDMIREITLTVRADGNPPFGTYWSGDLVGLVTKGWRSLPDGLNRYRLLTMSGSDSSDIRLQMQLEV